MAGCEEYSVVKERRPVTAGRGNEEVPHNKCRFGGCQKWNLRSDKHLWRPRNLSRIFFPRIPAAPQASYGILPPVLVQIESRFPIGPVQCLAIPHGGIAKAQHRRK